MEVAHSSTLQHNQLNDITQQGEDAKNREKTRMGENYEKKRHVLNLADVRERVTSRNHDDLY